MRALQENIGTPTDFSPERGRCRILFCSIPQAWQLTTGKDRLFCHQRKWHNFGLTDGAVPQPHWGYQR